MRAIRGIGAVALVLALAATATAQGDEIPRVVEISFEPTSRAQIAIWVERADGTYLRTLALTQSVAQEMMKPSRDVFEKASQSVVK